MSAEVEGARSRDDMEDTPPLEGLNGASDDDGDLFGDDDDDNGESVGPQQRMLDDSELDSGDDEGRHDRIAPTVEDEEGFYQEQKDIKYMEVDLARVKRPEGEDLYLLNMPSFLGISRDNFNYASYTPPDKADDGRDASTDPGIKFSRFENAESTIMWRRDPKNPAKLQSNARIVRWSDGSLTLQLASKPKDQFAISTTAMRQGWNKKSAQLQDYDPNKDSHNYLAAPHGASGIDLQLTAPFDASLRIQAAGEVADESVLKLKESLRAAANQQHDPLATLKITKEDPEMAKKAAELFEKDRMRTARKREAAEERVLLRKDRVLNRAGLGRLGGGGLSVAGLEDEDGMPTARGKKSKTKRRKTNTRGEIYSDDEDEDHPRGRTKEDEYDREDDFLAASDEEPEIYDDEDAEGEVEEEEDDPDVDDLEIEGRDTVLDNRTRRGNERDGGRREKSRGQSDDEALPQGSPQAKKRRRVIDDDDDE